MSIPAGNDATGASGTGPTLRYILNLFWFNILFMLISENNINTSTYFVHTLSLFYAMKLLVIFEIKIYRKLPSFLTGHRSLPRCPLPPPLDQYRQPVLNGQGASSSSQIHRVVVFPLSRTVNILRLNENETNRDEVAVRARAMPDGLPRRSSPAEVSGGCACLAGRGAEEHTDSM